MLEKIEQTILRHGANISGGEAGGRQLGCFDLNCLSSYTVIEVDKQEKKIYGRGGINNLIIKDHQDGVSVYPNPDPEKARPLTLASGTEIDLTVSGITIHIEATATSGIIFNGQIPQVQK